MAFFSFSLLGGSFRSLDKNLHKNQAYYSKDITLWKELTNKKKKVHLNFIKYENRVKINTLGKSLLLCLPPKFGLGDAIEYSIGINSLIKSKKFSKIGIAFCSNYFFVFKNIFSFKNIYPLFISSSQICKYDTIFHLTLELEAFKFQKYNRSDIALEICKYFNVPLINFEDIKIFKNNNTKKKISIFPISTSPLRSMPLKVINSIIKKFETNYTIEIFLSDCSYSDYLISIYSKTNVQIKNPINISDLIKKISKITFGIFMDSGPLHVAKLYKRNGVLLETSVSSKTLLDEKSYIKAVKNKYISQFCSGPCGLVDIFSFKDSVGCYETNKFSFQNVKKLKSLKDLQRRNKNENNSHFILNPVGCVNKIDIEQMIKLINFKLKECS